MIIFYNKKTGEIVGTIDGRIHTKEQLNMWIGDKKETDRIVVQWKPFKFYDDKGKVVEKKSMVRGKRYNADFEPDIPQKDIHKEIDKKPSELFKYKVDLKTKELISCL